MYTQVEASSEEQIALKQALVFKSQATAKEVKMEYELVTSRIIKASIYMCVHIYIWRPIHISKYLYAISYTLICVYELYVYVHI